MEVAVCPEATREAGGGSGQATQPPRHPLCHPHTHPHSHPATHFATLSATLTPSHPATQPTHPPWQRLFHKVIVHVAVPLHHSGQPAVPLTAGGGLLAAVGRQEGRQARVSGTAQRPELSKSRQPHRLALDAAQTNLCVCLYHTHTG